MEMTQVNIRQIFAQLLSGKLTDHGEFNFSYISPLNSFNLVLIPGAKLDGHRGTYFWLALFRSLLMQFLNVSLGSIVIPKSLCRYISRSDIFIINISVSLLLSRLQNVERARVIVYLTIMTIMSNHFKFKRYSSVFGFFPVGQP